MLTLILGCSGPETNIQQIYPNLVVSTEVVDFGEVLIGTTKTQSMQMINAGSGPLYIQDISLSDEGGAFTLLSRPEELGSDEISELQLEFFAQDHQSYTQEILIQSNDEERPELIITLSGEGGDGPQPNIRLDQSNLDFGDVAQGDEKLLFFTITNQGDASLQIENTLQSGSGSFQILGDLDGSELAEGVESSILVSYTPNHEEGDSGALVINSNDPLNAALTVSFIGNGGGTTTYPEAKINCPNSLTAPTLLSLSGSDSSSPTNGELRYQWSIVKEPIGSNLILTDPDGTPIPLSGDEAEVVDHGPSIKTEIVSAGDYQINLIVEDNNGTRSAPAECLFYAEPPSDVHIELSWEETSADLDLHLVNSETGLFSFEHDCCWCNTNPAWSTVSNECPQLTQDSEAGGAPEITDIDVAVDGTYYIRTHYFSDEGAGRINATIRIYLYGVLEAQYTEALEHNQIWDTAFIRWPEAYIIEESTEPYPHEGARSCQ